MTIEEKLKTIEEKLKAYADSLGVHPMALTIMQHAFLAGAAAMAEIFANGTALRVERVPVWYTVIDPDAPKGQEAYTLLAFTQEEAIKRFADECCMGYPYPGARCRPATIDEIEKVLKK